MGMAGGALLTSSPGADLGAAAATQARVVGALLLREMRGRSRLGYLWAVLSPIFHLILLTALFTAIKHRPAPLGESLALFLATGLLPYKLFTGLSGRTHSAIRGNEPLFAIPVIKPIDPVLARIMLEALTFVCVCFIVFTGLAAMDLGMAPRQPIELACAFFALGLLGTGIGVFNAAVARLFPVWERVYAVLTLPLFITSGIFYVPDLLPQKIRDVLVWNPVLHGVEWFRSGFYDDYGHLTLDRGYLLECGLAALLIGLAAERALRARERRP